MTGSDAENGFGLDVPRYGSASPRNARRTSSP